MRQYKGIIVHHSVCHSINGKGYDYFISRSGQVIPGSEPVDADYVHICLEGNFNQALDEQDDAIAEQIFMLQKWITLLYRRHPYMQEDILPHGEHCPGVHFPWAKLVISLEDRYH